MSEAMRLGCWRDWPFVAVHVPWLFREEAECIACIACESGLSAQMKAESDAAAAERHPSEVLFTRHNKPQIDRGAKCALSKCLKLRVQSRGQKRHLGLGVKSGSALE